MVRSNNAFVRCESNIGGEEGGKFASTDQVARFETAKLLSSIQIFPYFQAKLPLTLFPPLSPGPTRYCRVSRLRNEKTSIPGNISRGIPMRPSTNVFETLRIYALYIYIYISYSRCLQTLTVSFGMAPLSTTVIPVSIIAETMLAQRLE